MTPQIIIVLILTTVINLIVTLSYAVRIVGVNTGRIAITFSLFKSFAAYMPRILTRTTGLPPVIYPG